jgi:hypothetical protein
VEDDAMKNHALGLLILLFTCLSIGGAQDLSTPRLKILDIPGSVYTRPTAINDRREVIGLTYLNGKEHPFLMHDLDPSNIELIDVGTGYTYPADINNEGTIVGTYCETLASCHGFFRCSSGEVRMVAEDSISAINNLGHYVGWTSSPYQAFLDINGTRIEINYPGWQSTTPFRINDADDVVGFGYPPGYLYAKGFLYRNGDYSMVLPHGDNLFVYAIDNRGAMGGFYWDLDGYDFAGFVLRGKTLRIVELKNTSHTDVFGMNNRGEIVGSFNYASGDGSAGGVIPLYNGGYDRGTHGYIAQFKNRDCKVLRPGCGQIQSHERPVRSRSN